MVRCYVSGEHQKLYWLMIFLSMVMGALARKASGERGEDLVEPPTKGCLAAMLETRFSSPRPPHANPRYGRQRVFLTSQDASGE